MGKAIEELSEGRGHEIAFKVGREGFSADQLKSQQIDVAIEFSTPDSAVANIRKCIEAGVPVVVGTTAWYDQYDKICNEVEAQNGSLLTATNFSIGVNLFWKIVNEAARLFNSQPDYDVDVKEIHHLQKLDAPSGTAITTAQKLLAELDGKSKWVHHEKGSDPSNEPNHLNIESERVDGVPGTHIVDFHGPIDSIEIIHTAHNRRGFALGALRAAEWLAGRKGIFTMNDVLEL
ncbi:MAG: 4-hydroxy-tetrahydrodipicolinate reductase [Bacteroidetes bacterium]|nr:4-hydroxy-tetrahydrodipicolinate reductase [Bacteroidota bacterium]